MKSSVPSHGRGSVRSKLIAGHGPSRLSSTRGLELVWAEPLRIGDRHAPRVDLSGPALLASARSRAGEHHWMSSKKSYVSVTDSMTSSPCSPALPSACGSHYRPWAELLRRTFAVNVETCARCGGRMRLMALITEPQSVARFLRQRGEPTEPPLVLRRESRRTSRPSSSDADQPPRPRRSASCSRSTEH